MRLPTIVSDQEAPTWDAPTVTLKHTSRRVKYAMVWGRQLGRAGALCSGKQGSSKEEGWASSQDFQQEHHSEAADTFWASCQLTITCSETTVESNFPPSDSCQPVLLPTNFASLCTFQKIMALNSIEMGIISFQLINGPLQRCLDDASPPKPEDVVFTVCRALSCRLKCGPLYE